MLLLPNSASLLLYEYFVMDFYWYSQSTLNVTKSPHIQTEM